MDGLVMANRLKHELQTTVLRCLCEGCSIRATSRMTGFHPDNTGRAIREFGAIWRDCRQDARQPPQAERGSPAGQADESAKFVTDKLSVGLASPTVGGTSESVSAGCGEKMRVAVFPRGKRREDGGMCGVLPGFAGFLRGLEVFGVSRACVRARVAFTDTLSVNR